jgi:geranylgeranyl diphosphate synthase type I
VTASPTTSVPVPEALVRHRPVVSAAMAAAVARLSPELRRVAAYHLGWEDAEGRAATGDGGKALRPAIVLAAAEAVGGDPARAVPGAVALELVHNFSLIHDDVMDGDRERRHRPTVWALFGVAEAIVAGDALHALAQELLLEDERPETARAALELERATAEMIRGQAEDLAFESRLDVSEAECEAMCSHKTGALVACAGVLGATLGGGMDEQIDALRGFGRHLGIAFQAVDDILGIWGDPAVTGKPAASDLRQHKKTLPVVHALGHPRGASEPLARTLSNGAVDDERARGLVALLEKMGARAWATGVAQRHLDTALAHLDRADLDPRVCWDLRAIAHFVAGRDF